MFRFFFPFFLLALVSTASSQNIPPADPDEGKVFSFAEQMPEFPGGQEAMMRYLRDNIKYPARCLEANIQGNVYVSFVVNKSGQVQDVRVLKGVKDGSELETEALRVV